MAGSDGSIIIDTKLDNSGFQKGSAKLERSMASLSKSISRIGEIPFDSARFSTQVGRAKNNIEQLQAKLDELGSKTVSTVGYETTLQSISKAEQALEKLIVKQKFYDQLGISENSAQWRHLEMQIIDAEEKLARFNAQKDAMEANGTAFVSGAETEQYRQLSVALQEATEQLQQFERAKEKASKVSAFTSGLKKMIQGIGKYISHIKKSHSATSGLLKGLTSLKTMLFSRVKRMFISNIFNEMKEAMNALQQYDKSFGTAMNNMKSAAKGLSANLAVSFGGLISAIEPVLTKIISAISTAISYINALFAMLSGKSTMTVAKKQMDGYAKSTGGAAGAAKELNKQLMGFDELNRLSDNGDSGGGGGGGTNPADLFEEVPIDSLLPDSIKDYFERIKAAFEAGDWESIGSIIAEGLNSGMGAVDRWITGTLQPMAVLWSERTALLLNGLIKGVNWNLMGKTIADGLNTVFKSVDTFLTTFDFAATGQAVANLVIGFFSNIDWESIAHGLGEGIQGAFDFLSGFIQTVDWSALPGNILDTLLRIIKAVDWTGIASSFVELFGSAFGSVFALGAGIYDVIKGALSGLWDWLKNTFYENGEFTVDGFLNGLSETIKDIGSWIKTNIFEPFINGFCAAFGINSPSTVMAEQGGYIVAGLLQGITGAWDKITGFFGTALSGLKTGLESAWAGVKTAAGSAWDAVKTAVTNPFNTAKTAINATAETIKSGLSSAWTNIKSTAGTAWDNVETAATTPFNSMKSTLTNGVSSLQSSLDTGWNHISAGATQAWGNISSDVSAKWDTLKSTLQNTNWSTVGINICNGIVEGLNNGWNWLVQTVSNIASGLLNTAKRILGIHSPSRVFRDQIGENIGLGLAEGIENSEKDANRSVAALAKSTADGFGSQELSFNVAGSEMVSGLDRVSDKLSAIANTFQAITSMLDAVGSLVVPEIATGTVAPYKTRISSTFYDDNRGDYAGKTDPAKIDNIINLLSEVIRVVKDIDPTVVIDEDTIGMAATRYQNRRKLSLGV